MTAHGKCYAYIYFFPRCLGFAADTPSEGNGVEGIDALEGKAWVIVIDDTLKKKWIAGNSTVILFR